MVCYNKKFLMRYHSGVRKITFYKKVYKSLFTEPVY